MVLAWELYARISGISPTTLPAPSRVLFQAILQRQALFDNTVPT
ncbi:MAG: ABC transporter permease, partial [Mesorhizobium sp.]